MDRMSGKIAIGESHSKLILVGEHAVVYGRPAIALPFPLKVRSQVMESQGFVMLDSNFYSGFIDNVPVRFKGIPACIRETLKSLNHPVRDLHIRVDTYIPLGRGLGSSAAIAIAIVRSLFSFYGREPSEEELFSLVALSEAYAHGNPSGIDMAAESSDYPIWFEKGRGAFPIKVGGPLYIIVGDTGVAGDTRTAVENVRKKYLSEQDNVEKSLDRIKKVVSRARVTLMKGESGLLGRLLDLNHEELIDLGVSNEDLNRLVSAARKAGAFGAKMTGGGLGGCMMAIAGSMEDARAISDELIESGAADSWYFSMKGEVYHFHGKR